MLPSKRQPSTHWRLKTTSLNFASGPAIMGIVNVTPDSFSDGGQFTSHATAIDHAMELSRQGAAILDIGGESTRPYADPVSVQEELDRVVPVIEGIVARIQTPVSIDTSKSAVAAAAVDAGAQIINDVTGLSGDRDMLATAASAGVGVCAMHMQGTPQTMQDNPEYQQVVEDVLGWLHQRKQWLLDGGIEADRIALDPGIGFGKTHTHNLQLLQQASRFHATGSPILIGHSRKGFIGKLIDGKRMKGNREGDRTASKSSDLASRDAGTMGISVMLAAAGVQILRVHEVEATAHAIRCAMAIAPKQP